jgi:Transposase DDE domain group 1
MKSSPKLYEQFQEAFQELKTAEQWIKEGKQATHWTRLSCHRFRANEARLQLSLLAYNLGNLWRRLVLPKKIDAWSLTSLQQRLVKTGDAWSSTPAITGYCWRRVISRGVCLGACCTGSRRCHHQQDR